MNLDKKSLDDFNKLLRYIEKETDPVTGSKFARLIAEGAQEMATEAKKLCPVDYGRLRSSIHAKLKPSDNFQYTDTGTSARTGKRRTPEQFDGSLKEPVEEGKEAVVGTNVEYAFKQELSKQYMYGAVVKVRPNLRKNIQKLAKEVIHKQ